jgi:protein phosphatase
MRIDIAAQSDTGRRKSKNEDNYGVFREDTPGLQLFEDGVMMCVADGLGGHVGGEIASKLAVSMMRDCLKEAPQPDEEGAEEEEDQGPLPVIEQAFKRANESIQATNRDLVKEGRPMGTTLVTAVLAGQKIFVGNVGDSRAYHLRNGEIICRTEDHSWVDEQVKQGKMSKAEAERDHRKNVVTRCIGTHESVDMDRYIWHAVPGDALLLCSDGLVNMVKDQEIAAEFQRNAQPSEIAQRLVNLANENGGKDNITVIVADIGPSASRMLKRRISTFAKGKGVHAAWAVIAAAAFAAGYLIGLAQ